MEHSMILFNKDHPVLRLLYDEELHAVTKILEFNELAYAPPAILGIKGIPDRKTLNDWWRGRSIPASRNHLRQDFPYLDDPRSLTEACMGLSLSDRYWMREEHSNLKWDDVNFFDNPFTDDLGHITLGEVQQSHDGSENFYSPNATLGGDLRKRWIIRNEERLLIKSGSGPFCQEPYNEVIATALHKRLLEPNEFVPYKLEKHHCICPNMLKEDEELVPIWDVLSHKKKPNNKSDFEFCQNICQDLGLASDDVYHTFEKMFVCDLLLGNQDRHYRNFGLIRNVESLEYTHLAPIYDTGASLWYDRIELNSLSDYSYMAKPFGKNGMTPTRQLALFYDFAWLDLTRLNDFTDETNEILKKNPLMNDGRRDAILRGLNRNINMVSDFVTDRNRKHAAFITAVKSLNDEITDGKGQK